MRTNWSVLGVGDFSIESIPKIISSTNEHELYEGAIFKNKDELKTSLGKYALKQKFEYRITRSFKTRFLASCKDKSCTFKLRAGSVLEGSYWTVAKFVRDHSCQLELFNNCSWQVPAKVVSTVIIDKLLGKGRVIQPVDVIGEMKSSHGIEILYSKAWKAKEYAQNMVYGFPLDSFQMLPSYFYILEQQNQGTVTIAG